jgi:hypothetical protein
MVATVQSMTAPSSQSRKRWTWSYEPTLIAATVPNAREDLALPRVQMTKLSSYASVTSLGGSWHRTPLMIPCIAPRQDGKVHTRVGMAAALSSCQSIEQSVCHTCPRTRESSCNGAGPGQPTIHRTGFGVVQPEARTGPFDSLMETNWKYGGTIQIRQDPAGTSSHCLEAAPHAATYSPVLK